MANSNPVIVILRIYSAQSIGEYMFLGIGMYLVVWSVDHIDGPARQRFRHICLFSEFQFNFPGKAFRVYFRNLWQPECVKVKYAFIDPVVGFVGFRMIPEHDCLLAGT